VKVLVTLLNIAIFLSDFADRFSGAVVHLTTGSGLPLPCCFTAFPLAQFEFKRRLKNEMPASVN
jgi:hypothetical protein